MPELYGVQQPRSGLVGKKAAVRVPDVEPSYFTDAHRRWIGSIGTIHAVVEAQPLENPLVKLKFGNAQQVVFYRLVDLDVTR